MVSELLKKYIWLVQTFIRAGDRGLSLTEVSSAWKRRFGGNYPRQSFNNHREAVAEIFGIEIECDRSSNRYSIRSADDVSDENAETAWLINTFTVNNMLSLGRERLSGRISVEDIPSGHKYLTGLMEAMPENRTVRLGYMKYTSEETEMLTVRPYAVKEASKRWYLVGYCIERQGMRVYGLDRITEMEILEERFSMPEDFDVDVLFATSFGIYLSDSPGRRIVFRATRREARFLRDLPIHHSQKECGEEENFVNFEIFVTPNDNLIMELCRYGNRIEVLGPEDVRNAVAEALGNAARLYGTTGTPLIR